MHVCMRKMKICGNQQPNRKMSLWSCFSHVIYLHFFVHEFMIIRFWYEKQVWCQKGRSSLKKIWNNENFQYGIFQKNIFFFLLFPKFWILEQILFYWKIEGFENFLFFFSVRINFFRFNFFYGFLWIFSCSKIFINNFFFAINFFWVKFFLPIFFFIFSLKFLLGFCA